MQAAYSKRHVLIILISLVIISGCNRPPSVIEVFQLTSNIFKNTRSLRVYLPPGFNVNNSYSLLLLNDGQHALGTEDIDKEEDWKVDEIADSLIIHNEIPPVVIVGIDHLGMSLRGNEYLPWEDIYLNPPIPDPQGHLYPKFLLEEVLPFLHSKIPLKNGFKKIGIGGFSYGGLIALYTGIKYPSKFDFVLAESPSLYVNEQKLIQISIDSASTWPDKVYMGIGTNELALKNCEEENEDNRMAVQDVRHLNQIINDHSPHTYTKVTVAKCATHTFAEASERLPEALKFILN